MQENTTLAMFDDQAKEGMTFCTSTFKRPRRVLTGIAALSLVFGAACARQTRGESSMPPNDTSPTKTGYAPVNGLSLYYEIHGSGAPLVLLHGGFGSVEMMSVPLSALAQERQVIAVDLQAHGRTADIDRPLTYEHMADDIAGLLRHLGIERADVIGYSLGGGVALWTAIRHPRMVRKLIVVSVPARRTGWYDEVLAAMAHVGPEIADTMKQSPMYQLYAKIAPRPQDFPVLVTKLGELIRRDFDWSKEIAALTMPTLVVFADADSVHPAHVVEFYALLGGGQRDPGWDGAHRPKSQLAILPGRTHYDLNLSPMLATVASAFLDAGGAE